MAASTLCPQCKKHLTYHPDSKQTIIICWRCGKRLPMRRSGCKYDMLVGFLPHQKVLYDKEDPRCLYELHHTRKGIHKSGGNFYAMVAKKLFVDLGYKVQHT